MSSNNCVIYYYQTFCGLDAIIQSKHKPDNIHLSSIHFGLDSENQPYIHLNNYTPGDPKFSSVWTQLQQCKQQGINITLMIGGAGGGYRSLFSNYATYYRILKQLLIDKTGLITGVDLDIEEIVSLKDTLKLITDIKHDFPDMTISMSPVQFSLETDVPGMGGFCYKDILKTNLVDYFIGQFYTDFSLDAFTKCVENGYSPEKIVIGMISGQDFGDNLDAISEIKKRYPNADLDDEEFMTEQILEVAHEVQDYINKSYDVFASRMLNVKGNHRFDIKQECIAKSAFWVTKKRYGQWIINDGGIKCDKLDVKGLDIVRSNFPPAMRDLMTEVLQGVLSKRDKDELDELIVGFKKKMKTMPIGDVALPTGVSRLSKFIDKRHSNKKIYGKGSIFTDTHKGTPVHVKAAWIYNDLLDYHKLNNVEKIKNSEKIKWVYLKQNPLSIAQIAFKGYDDPKEIMDYINQYVNHNKLFEKALKKKIDMFYDSMGWTLVDKKNTLERFF